MFDLRAPLTLDDVPAYQQALYLRHLEQMADFGVTGPNARAHARAVAWRAADQARDRIDRASSAAARLLARPQPPAPGAHAMPILPTAAAKTDDKSKTKPAEEKKPQSVFHYRMDELGKAKEAIHLAADVMDDEHQIAKLKKAEKLAKEVHAEAKAKKPTPEAPKDKKKS